MAHNFADLYEHSVDAMPDRVALIAGGRQITFLELERRANRLAHHLESVGFGKNSHIGFHMHNSIETIETLIACYKIRAVPVNINYRYTRDELRYVYDNADLEGLVHHRKYADAIAEVLPSVPNLRHCIVVEDDLGGAVRGGSAIRCRTRKLSRAVASRVSSGRVPPTTFSSCTPAAPRVARKV